MNYKVNDKKMKIAFVYQVPSFWPSWDSLYSKCKSDENIKVKLFRINDSHGDKAQMSNSEDFLIRNNIDYEEFSYEKVMNFAPDYMIYQTPYDRGHRPIETWTARFRKEGIKIVYIPYGIEISDTIESRYKHFSLSVVLNSFRVFVMSDAIKREYDKYCINASVVSPMGLPRFDALMRKYDIPKEYQDKVNGRKIILWKSHFPKIFIENGVKKQATPNLSEYIKFIEYIKATKDLYFVFMPHPKFVDQTIDHELLPQAQLIIKKLKTIDNAYIDISNDYRNSLTNADAIIVDRSAVMVEAGIKNVPVLYMSNNDYYEPMTEPIQKLLDSYYQGASAREMIDFCEMIRNGEDGKHEIRKQAFEECVLHLDGKCADRIVENLWDNCCKEYESKMVCKLKSYSKIVVFGTGDISDYCMKHFKTRKDKSVEIVAFVDNDTKKQGEFFYNREIISPEQLKNVAYDYIMIASDKYYREFYIQAIQLGISERQIINYDQFIVLTLLD